jgi:hypothetical protein
MTFEFPILPITGSVHTDGHFTEIDPSWSSVGAFERPRFCPVRLPSPPPSRGVVSGNGTEILLEFVDRSHARQHGRHALGLGDEPKRMCSVPT